MAYNNFVEGPVATCVSQRWHMETQCISGVPILQEWASLLMLSGRLVSVPGSTASSDQDQHVDREQWASGTRPLA